MANIDQRQMLPMGAVLDRRYRIIKYLASENTPIYKPR